MSRRRPGRAPKKPQVTAAAGSRPVAELPVAELPAGPTTETLAEKMHAAGRFLGQCWRWVEERRSLTLLQGKHRRLRVTETVALGEKRFVAIVEADGAQFLIGGSATGVSLLKELRSSAAAAAAENFHAVLEERWQPGGTA